MTQQGILKSGLSKKLVMGLTGLFLISFLLVHLGINLLALLPDGGQSFDMAAEFMATNPLIRTMEIGLFAGFIIHILDSAVLTYHNRKARSVGYAMVNGKANSAWYSRSMGLLGTLILMFLIIHLYHFWAVSRFGSIEDEYGRKTLYLLMFNTFKSPWVVILYALTQVSLAYHLMHGFQSAFQTVGINHSKYTPLIKIAGTMYAILVPLLFAIIPIVLYIRATYGGI
jgi:succinate dehydrogenase / fumarate reductase, cytochrome b subunit